MKPTIFELADPQLVDISAEVSTLCRDFGIPFEAEPRLLDTIAHCDAKRFARPYKDGAELAMKRPFGPDLRAIVERNDLTAKLLFSLDHVTCDEAGMLELLDRLGIKGLFEAIHIAAHDESDHMPAASMETRIAPVAHEHILPFVREAMATFLNDEIGMKASKRHDFKKKKGRLVVVPGRIADFIQRALAIAGWDFTAEEIAENYGAVLMKRAWVRHPRPRRRAVDRV